MKTAIIITILLLSLISIQAEEIEPISKIDFCGVYLYPLCEMGDKQCNREYHKISIQEKVCEIKYRNYLRKFK